MWIRRKPVEAEAGTAREPTPPSPPRSLQDAIRQVRVELAEQSAVIVDLRDAEVARLELLNEAIEPLFNEIPPEVDMFDRGISRGDNPRLWIDMIAHVHMGRDKRRYRFVQDTRYGRKLLAESNDIQEIAGTIQRYIAARLVERERALAVTTPQGDRMRRDLRTALRRRRWRTFRTFVLGVLVGLAAVFAVAWLLATRAH
jgi:hypothetical protein